MDKLSDFGVKVILGIVGLVLLAGLAWFGVHSLKKDVQTVTTLVSNNAKKDEVINAQQGTIAQDAAVAKVDNDVGVQVATDTKTVDIEVTKIRHNVDSQTQAIVQKYDALPKTAVNLKAEQDNLSTARINGLWDTYCSGDPDADECKPDTPPVNTPAAIQGEQHA